MKRRVFAMNVADLCPNAKRVVIEDVAYNEDEKEEAHESRPFYSCKRNEYCLRVNGRPTARLIDDEIYTNWIKLYVVACKYRN